MKRLMQIVFISALSSTTHQASIGHRNDQNPPSLSKIFHSQQHLQPSAVFDNADAVLNAIDTAAKFIRDYNAISKIGSCLKFIMPRFKTGRKILMYYDHVKAKHEGRFQLPQKGSKSNLATVPKTTYVYVYIHPSQADLGMAKALSIMKKASGEARVPQALKRVTCYNCRTRKEQWKRYNTFQNRRKRWPKQYYNPTHIIPASNELHLLDYVTVTATVKPITEITTRSFRDILPGPNQLPYYANMFLDVFDTHFETWNAKIRSAIHTIKQKWGRRSTNKAKTESQSSYSCSGSGSCSSSDYSSSSDYDGTGSETDSSSYSSSSSDYYDENEYSNRNAAKSSDERRNERFHYQNITSKLTNKANAKDEDYDEYYSDLSDERERFKPIYKNKRRRNFREKGDLNQNLEQITKKQPSKVSISPLINYQKNKLKGKKVFRGTHNTSSSSNKTIVRGTTKL